MIRKIHLVLLGLLIITIMPIFATDTFSEDSTVNISTTQQANTSDQYQDTPPAPPTTPSQPQTNTGQTAQTQQPQQGQQNQSNQEVTQIRYVVKRGDYLWKIAKELLGDGSRYVEIIEANKDRYPSLARNPNIIHPGWELIIPVRQPSSTSAQSNQTQQPSSSSSQQGQQPSQIATSTQQPNQVATSSQQASNNRRPYIEVPTDRPLTTDEKKRYLQSAVNAAQIKLGRTITVLDVQTVRLMIDMNIISDEGWMALNPPPGYRWAIKNRRVDLITDVSSSINQPQDNQPPSQPASPTQPQPQNPPSPTQNVSTQGAFEKFNNELQKMGMPLIIDTSNNWFSSKDDEYREAIIKGTRYHNSYHRFLNYQNNLYRLQYEMLEAYKLYEQKVKERATDPWFTIPFVGIQIGETIESAARKANEAKKRLEAAWSQFKAVHSEAKQKLQADKDRIAQLEAQKRNAEARLQQIGNNMYDPNFNSEVSALMKTINDAEKEIKAISDKIIVMDNILRMFP